MAVVTHGPKDATDQVLEILNGLERSLKHIKASVDADAPSDLADQALERVGHLRDQASLLRGEVEKLTR